MHEAPREPWNPHRSWADPLITLLALLALMAGGFTLSARRETSKHPAERVSLQGRLTEVAIAGPGLLPGIGAKTTEWAKVETQLKEPWDRAMVAILKAEHQSGGLGAKDWIDQVAPTGPGGLAFRRACLAAYAEGPLPGRADRDDIHRRLGKGYAADLLEARLLDRDGKGDALRTQARATLMTRLALLGFLGLLVLGTGTAGLLVGVYLVGTRKKAPPRPLPVWALSGRAAALVLLTWFLSFFFSSTLVGLLLHPWPWARWLAGPLTYVLHAAIGITLLCWAEDIGLPQLWRRVAPDRMGRDLAWGLAFLALALFLVMLVALLSGWILQPDQSPQRDLQELLRGLSGWGPNLVMFLTVAGLAPCFEELLFRGAALPALGLAPFREAACASLEALAEVVAAAGRLGGGNDQAQFLLRMQPLRLPVRLNADFTE